MDHEMNMKDFLHHRYGFVLSEWKDPVIFGSLISVFVTAMFSVEHFKMWPLIIATAITAYSIYDLQRRCREEYMQKVNYLQMRLDSIKENIYIKRKKNKNR